MATKAIQKLGTIATCGHAATRTGIPTVFINGFAAIRVGDTAGGAIAGPGNPTVLIEGQPASLEGDFILSHGDSPHDSAKTGIVVPGNVRA